MKNINKNNTDKQSQDKEKLITIELPDGTTYKVEL